MVNYTLLSGPTPLAAVCSWEDGTCPWQLARGYIIQPKNGKGRGDRMWPMAVPRDRDRYYDH